MDIPGYKIEKLIAEGGMADVYLAIQKSLDRRVALKLLQKFVKAEQSDRFLNEGRIIASLYHSNIITIYDIGGVDGQHYISMEYLEGGDLENRIRKGITPDAAIDLIATIGHCLELVHSKGIIHRDIKPANILFRRDETPVLSDFGIAKQLNQDTSLTMDGTAMGSPDYLSPEQAECKALDGRTDIYSLGIVFYEMLTGHKPYQGNSYIEIVMLHIRAPIPTLPSHLERYQVLLERMIAKDPEKRFDTVTDMVAYIDKFFRTPPRKGVLTKIADLFRKLRTPRQVADEPVKTLEMSMDELPTDSGPAASRDDAIAPNNSHAGRSRPIFRRTLIVTVILVLIAGLVWVPKRIPEETLPTRSSVTEVDLASVTEDVSTSSTATEVEPEVLTEELFIDTTQDEIKEYLRKAKAALNKYKLTLPKNDSAYFYYQKVIELERGNKEARQGLVKVADRYAQLAEQEIGRYEYTKAKQYVSTGLRVQPRHKKLLALQKRTNATKDIPTRIFKSIKSVFE